MTGFHAVACSGVLRAFAAGENSLKRKTYTRIMNEVPTLAFDDLSFVVLASS